MFLRWVDGKAQVTDALTKLHGDGDLLRAVYRQAFTVLLEAPEIMAARRQEKRERERVPRVKSPLSCGSLWTKRRCLCSFIFFHFLTFSSFSFIFLIFSSFFFIFHARNPTFFGLNCFKISCNISFKTIIFLSRLGRYLFGSSFPFFSRLHFPFFLFLFLFLFFSKKKVSSFTFSCISFKKVSLLVQVSKFQW